MNEVKLLALTHNYIGPNLSKSLPNEPIVQDGRVVIPISGEHLIQTEPPASTLQGVRHQMLDGLYDREVLESQHPNIVLVYVGMGNEGDVTQAMEFARNASFVMYHCQVHIVWPVEISRRRLLYYWLGNGWGRDLDMPIVHFAESTGNLTMQRLIDEFLATGTIQDPANVFLKNQTILTIGS